MKKFTVLAIVILLGALLFFFVAGPTNPGLDTTVTKPGIYKFDDSAELRVLEDSNGLLNVLFAIDGSTRGWPEGFIDPKEEWFIYIDRRSEIWLTRAGNVTLIFDYEKAGGFYGLFNCHDPEVLNLFIYDIMPQGLRSRLPGSILERAEAAEQRGRLLLSDPIFIRST